MFRRHFRVLVASLLLGAGAAQAGTPLRVGLGFSIAYLPFFVAADQGLFQRQGLDVTYTKISGSNSTQDALLSPARST